MKSKKTHLIVFLLFPVFSLFANNIFVSHSKGNDKNKGDSWDESFKTISKAIKKAANGDSIYIGSGTYVLTNTLRIKDNISIFGGYSFGDNIKEDRPLKDKANPYNFKNETIITGSVYKGINLNPESSNTRLFEFLENKESNIIIDGLTFLKGGGKSGINDESGGAIYSKTPGITIRNCSFKENGVTKESNAKGGNGGALLIENSAIIENCYFLNNFANSGLSGGGAIYINPTEGESIIKNCVFEENSSNIGSGAIRVDGNRKVLIENCTFFNNIAADGDKYKGGAAVYLAGDIKSGSPSTSEIKNCLIYNNTGSSSVYISGGTVSYSTIVNNIGNFYIASEDTNINHTIIWNNISGTSGGKIGLIVRKEVEIITVSECATDYKHKDYPMMVLKPDNNDVEGPQFTKPIEIIGINSDSESLRNADFSTNSQFLIKYKIGKQTNKL